MRRAAIVLGTAITGVLVSVPAYAYAHDRVTNPYLHAVLDLITFAVVSAPIWSAFLWGAQRRGLLLALIAIVQVPSAVIAFVPIANPVLHAIALVTSLAITIASVGYVRRAARAPQTAIREVAQ
ncbi:hypothetical protein F4553_002809 [Allocatelliglobosispora scoriae]|uniref:Uncharacterized protein n=1 Tax=Allocatelliglobosispora scoriae TaxID=643052 RepID=A0A841BRK2_9ACTN|nr:hypothetical protein [Allocatelliglobosispora scoriae]MBB5869430.1 hypothetical protein [Allocatelliglobosispora scoriae]